MTRAPFTPIDETVRHRAITETGCVLHVEAGAGTGKTSLLTSRFVHLVESGAASPSQIVAITFTEKAASQLKDKIRRAFEEKKLTAALEELDRAPISTIHSFAGSLLRERPFEAGIDPNFEQLDALSAELFLQSSYDRWLSDALANPIHSPSPLSRSISAGLKLDRVRDLALELYAHRDLLPSLLLGVPDLDVEPFFQELLSEATDLWGIASRACVNTDDAGYQAIESLYRELDGARGGSRATKERGILLRFSAPSKGNQQNWAVPAVLKKQKERMKALDDRLKTARATLRQAIFAELARWLVTFVEFVEREKKLAGKLDFDDLLFKVRDLLQARPEIQEYFRERFRFILVDEFQDTDPIQTEIIWRLASKSNEKSWQDLELEAGKLFIVGDPKQSIYRFRRASVEVYAAANARLSKQGERLVIHQNFRSSPPLIEWVNAVFPFILKEGYEPIHADSRHLFQPKRAPVILLEPPADETYSNAGDTRRLEAEAIAAYLHSLLHDPDPRVSDPKSGELRSPRPGDVAILFPTTTDLDIFEEALRRYDLPFSLEGGHLFYHRTEIHAVLSALDAIAHPTDPIAVVAALRSVLFGLSDQDLLTLAQHKISLDYRSADVAGLPQPIPAAFTILKELHEIHAHRLPSQTLSELFCRSAAIPITLTRHHGEQAAANLERFLSLARHHEKVELTSLDRFVQWARQRTEEAERAAESPLSDEDERRIRLLTIHKAKGLEFPVVVLANLSVQADRGEPVIADRFAGTLAIGLGSKDARFGTNNYEEISEREKQQRSEEKRRLLYVAATRARDILILPRFLPDRRGQEHLWSLLDEGIEHGSRWLERVPFSKLSLRDPAASSEQVDTRSVADDLAAETSKVRAALAERPTHWVRGLPIQTATELVSHEPHQTPPPNMRLDPSGATVGSALHALMERIDFQKHAAQLPALCRTVAIEFGIPDMANDLQVLAEKTFAAPIFLRIAASKRIYREVPFSWKKGDVIYEGVLDLVFEEADGLVLIDYKTDRVDEAASEDRALLYRPQIQLYADALCALAHKPIQEAVLFFVRLPKTVSLLLG